jgi:hypothetical protein
MRVHLLVLSLFFAALPGSAHAFCGFFVAGSNEKLSSDASKVVLMRKGNRTAMTLSNNYKGPTESFAMVVPVPVVLHKEDVKTLDPDVFDHIDQLSAPRLVEYWEQDPCAPRLKYDRMARGAVEEDDSAADRRSEKMGVKVEARFAVGEYQIVILSAKEAGGLETWLRDNRYNIPSGAASALAPYIQGQQKFFVAKVDITKVHRDARGTVVLSPLRVIFDSPELRLPVRLGLLNANGKQDLIVYILNPKSRFEVANYPNVFAPTNLEVLDEVRTKFASFYAALFDATLAKSPKAIVTEYAWQTSSCDPCPVPPLQAGDLAVLGDDVLSGNKATRANGQKGEYYGESSDWVLTRLHTRYSKDTLTEDLIFRAAKPMVGGRAGYDTQSIEGPGEAKPDSTNNFQARYIIRHKWTGKIACAQPMRNEWGGPPSGAEPAMQSARDLAAAPREGVALRKVVKSKLPSLGLPGSP